MKTPEKINGMTPEEIKNFLTEKERFVWIRRKKLAALEYIEHLEKKAADAQERIEDLETDINLMKIQMEGYCGVCKHQGEPQKCAQCRSFTYHPCWEYEGLPELPTPSAYPKKGASE